MHVCEDNLVINHLTALIIHQLILSNCATCGSIRYELMFIYSYNNIVLLFTYFITRLIFDPHQ